MTYIVALTGGIGSGKSTVANAFANLGVPVIDADIISRQVVEPGTVALNIITARYGDGILLTNGELNRATLREKIFSEQQEKEWLNALLHPLIQQETLRQLAAIDELYVIWVVPLLIENNLHQQANRVLLVDVPPEIQRIRTMARDSTTRQQVEHILASQASREQRLACADDVIDNSGDLSMSAELVGSLHKQYLRLATVSQQDLYQ